VANVKRVHWCLHMKMNRISGHGKYSIILNDLGGINIMYILSNGKCYSKIMVCAGDCGGYLWWLYSIIYNKNNIDDKIHFIYTSNYVWNVYVYINIGEPTYYINDFGILAYRESLGNKLGFWPNLRGCMLKRVFIYYVCVCSLCTPFIFLAPKTFYFHIDKQTE